MSDMVVRPMRADEFQDFRELSAEGYAEAKVTAGTWTAEEAPSRALASLDEHLPQGPDTPRAILLVAETPAHERVGHVWLGLDSPDGSDCAWIYDIEVVPGQRGHGYGRELLLAAERAAASAGSASMGLNVFGSNAVAIGLYRSAGYDVTSMWMHRSLGSTDDELT